MYELGELVKIRNDLIGGKDYYSKASPRESLYFNSEMNIYKGSIRRVIDIPFRFGKMPIYILSGDDGIDKWAWSDEMLLPVTKETIQYYLRRRKNAD